MASDYKPISNDYRNELEALAAAKKYTGIRYYTAINELLKTTSMIKSIYPRDEVEYLLLNSGEEIRLDRVVEAGGKVNPAFSHFDFSTDCSL